jgi:hypothetical protein
VLEAARRVRDAFGREPVAAHLVELARRPDPALRRLPED